MCNVNVAYDYVTTRNSFIEAREERIQNKNAVKKFSTATLTFLQDLETVSVPKLIVMLNGRVTDPIQTQEAQLRVSQAPFVLQKSRSMNHNPTII